MKKLILLLALAFPLQSCSYSYTVLAKMIGGRLAFVPDDSGNECISVIKVIAEGPRAPDPSIDNLQDPVAKGDAIVRVRAAWIADGVVNDCLAPYPIFYGSPLPEMPAVIPPRRLRAGEPYSVVAGGPSGTGGHGCFRLTRDGGVENLPYRECASAEPMPPQPAAPVVTIMFPAIARATPGALIRPGDVPSSSLPAEGERTVRFVLEVGTDGRAARCAVVKSSGSSALDAANCRVMKSRARFTPAMNSMSFPVVSSIEQELTWTPAGAKNVPRNPNRPLGAELHLWDEPTNTVRSVGRFDTMPECRAELGRMASKGRPAGEKAFCFDAPSTNFTPPDK